MSDGYLIPAQQQRVTTAVSNSRFITTIGRVTSVDEAKAFLAAARAEMPDANHHVYAYRVGYGNSVIEGMSDDGEPSGTSGPPVLAVPRGSGIGDVIVVVTRYFGGTKLGTGGLVRAYGDAARVGLESLPTERKIDKQVVGIEIPYHHFEQVKRLVARFDGSIDDETFAGDITILASFPVDQIDSFSAALVELTAGSVQPVLL
ncbi:MAG: YigZ family protein [Anaerolineae bacterium]|nr:YigZ family protein [Anaerolineae bacterium]